MTGLTQWKMGSPFLAANVGTISGVTASVASIASATFIVTHISGSSDLAALVTIESPVGTPIWRKRFAAAFQFAENFPPGPINGGPAQSIGVKISASTANCEAQIAGYRAD